MKAIVLIVFAFFCFSCERNDVFRSETDEHFSIIQEDIKTLPEIPINFYWEPEDKGQITTQPITTCLTSQVQFEKPYVIANGIKFHAYYWTRTENKLDIPNRTIKSTTIAFNKEK